MNFNKRFFDVLFSLFCIILTLPFIILFGVLVKLESRGPVFYWSKRIGIHSKIFYMPKLRSMHLTAPDIPTHMFKTKKHITKIGSFLRKFSIDEWPQFYLVFLGKMTLVGPRPALHNQEKLIKLRKKFKVDTIYPGITGLAQISGRDKLSIKKKLSYDILYLKKQNLFFDLKIIFLTLLYIIKSKDIAH